MELTLGGSLALVLCFYLSVVPGPASAKCRGEWAIHACFGGNGKRSDPGMEPGLLHRVLISNSRSRLLQNEPAAQPEEETPVYDEEVFKPEISDESYPKQPVMVAPETRDFRRYLLALKLQQALRRREGNLI